jgi:xylan 1,4-beta-xylosidase
MNPIRNPILPGFHPDPSVLRVGKDYYIATSTFEWFPGVEIFHSRDLAHWELAARPLCRASQLDLRGIPCSCGIWAPCLSYADGVYYLVYTIVNSTGGAFKDTDNYLVTTRDLRGEWSEPIYLNSTGFDPSLFHDEDGSKWLVNMAWDYRGDRNSFGGVLLQEYSVKEEKLVGTPVNIFRGSQYRKTEGPHLYRRGGWYYLIAAEGGTGQGHVTTMARSETITGPYKLHPQNPVLTSRYNPDLELKRAGHADLVETEDGDWYMVHLCARPLDGYSVLGRETAIQKVKWDENGWLRLEDGGREPKIQVPALRVPEFCLAHIPVRDHFDAEKLDLHYSTLRMPLGPETLSLTERPGFLRLHGRQSLHSTYRQALVARQQESFVYTAETKVEFAPEDFRQMAGLVCLHDNDNYFYLHVSGRESGKVLRVLSCDNGKYTFSGEVRAESQAAVYLRAHVDHLRLWFFYSFDGENWNPIGDLCNMRILSDEHSDCSHFTGAFVGVCCQDLSGAGQYADFDYFDYNGDQQNFAEN